MNTTDPVIHDEACIRALARQEAYDLRWSARCEICFGSGGVYLSFDPSAGIKGISLARGQMEDFDTCVCVNAGRCPRCAKQLLGPKWRPLNVRIWLAAKVERLAGQLRSLEMDMLFQAIYWRASALFRADPNFWTWAAYHVADQIWDRLTNRTGGRGQALSRALWQLQAWIEHSYESTETPCWHCGWNWVNSPGDAREPRICECWISSFEAEQDQVQDWLEQERQHRATIALSEDGATHLLIGLACGPIPMRRIWGPRPEESEGA